MKRRLRVLGHPVHAALSDFPLVLLLLWVALDGTALVVDSPLLWMLGRWALIGGTAAAVLAASAGFMDYLTVGETVPRALRTASARVAGSGDIWCSTTESGSTLGLTNGAEGPLLAVEGQRISSRCSSRTQRIVVQAATRASSWVTRSNAPG